MGKPGRDAAAWRCDVALLYGRVHYNHGQVLLLLKEPARAEQAITQALALSPQDQQAFVALAGLYLGAGQTDKARALAARIPGQAPGSAAAMQLRQRPGQ